MTQAVHLFLEDEEAEELEGLAEQIRAGTVEVRAPDGQAVVPEVLLKVLDTIAMWKEPA